ncbi:MAG: hypothetical protein KDD77_19895, partial [Caldilineaceae bacterium]|nr:hypothetical protein [Caldilineaceae bacterium]
LRGTIGYWISAIPLYLGYIWAGFDGSKEGWHDKIFDTHIVKVPWEEQPLRTGPDPSKVKQPA